MTWYNRVSSWSKKPILLPQNDSSVWARFLVCFLLLYSILTYYFTHHPWIHHAIPQISEGLPLLELLSHRSHVFFGQKVRFTQSPALRQKGQPVGQSLTLEALDPSIWLDCATGTACQANQTHTRNFWLHRSLQDLVKHQATGV